MSRYAYVNGAFLPHRDAMVHVEDRGMQFADSIYEVFAVLNGALMDEEGHWARLERSLDEIRQPMPMGRSALRAQVCETVRRNRVRDGLVYMQITRGVARRDHFFPDMPIPQTVVITARRSSMVQGARKAVDGIAIKTAPDIRWGRRDIKTTALLPNVLAKQAARDAGAQDAWLVDEDGLVTEGASANAWIVDADGALVTRALSHALLPGVTRFTVLRLAAERQMAIVERAFSVAEAKAAREAFITSAGNFVQPVVRIDEAIIADGKPGPIAVALRRAYMESASQGS